MNIEPYQHSAMIGGVKVLFFKVGIKILTDDPGKQRAIIKYMLDEGIVFQSHQLLPPQNL